MSEFKCQRPLRAYYPRLRSGLVLAAVLTLALAFGVGIEVALVPTPSMQATILVGDHLLVDKLLYGPVLPLINVRLPAVKQVRRGDIVSVRVPGHWFALVKRVVALGNDRIELRDGAVYVNSTRLREPFAEATQNSTRRGSVPPLIVPVGMLFLLGDNRGDSEDSRDFGAVPASDVIGEPVLICWSFAVPRSEWLDDAGHVRLQAYGSVLRNLLTKTRWQRMGRILR